MTSTKQTAITEIDAAYQSNNCKRYIPPLDKKQIIFVHCFKLQFKSLTLVTNARELKNIMKQEMNATFFFFGLRFGYSSITEEMIASI